MRQVGCFVLFSCWYCFALSGRELTPSTQTHHKKTGSAQYAFIAADLAAVDRARTPWLLVGGHRPMYISSTNAQEPGGDQVVAAALRDAVEPLFL